MADGISFKATFPDIMSAIKVTGNNSGMRIQLDIPESEMAEAVKLLMLRNVVLDVTIALEQANEQADSGPNRTLKRTAAKRRDG